jgi:hypothetical protein
VLASFDRDKDSLLPSARILEQFMGARNRVGIGLPYWPARLNVGGFDSLESIPGLLESLKNAIWSLLGNVDAIFKYV